MLLYQSVTELNPSKVRSSEFGRPKGRELLTHAGQISHQKALVKSALECENYEIEQKEISSEMSLKELEDDVNNLEIKHLKS